MCNDPDLFPLPELTDEAAVALDQFLEALYHHVHQHYAEQRHLWEQGLAERDAHDHLVPEPPLPLTDPPF